MKQRDLTGHRMVTSHDGVVTFVLRRAKAGVHVERRQEDSEGSQAHVASVQALFETGERFAQFVDMDSMRFSYPLTYEHLKRHFDELIDES